MNSTVHVIALQPSKNMDRINGGLNDHPGSTGQPSENAAGHRRRDLLERKLAKCQILLEECRANGNSKKYDVVLEKKEEYLNELKELEVNDYRYEDKGALDPKQLTRKLKKTKKIMKELEATHGTECFSRKDYRQLLKKAEKYESALEKFQVHMLSADDQPTSTTKRESATNYLNLRERRSRRPSKHKQTKTTAVRATRIQELESKFQPPVYPKTEDDASVLEGVVKSSFVFSSIHKNNKAIQELVDAFEPTPAYAPGEVIIAQGDQGDYFYVIREGSVDFEVSQELVGSAQAGKHFGELALLYNFPRKATVRASPSAKSTRLWKVDQITFRYILQSRLKFLKAVNKVICINRIRKSIGFSSGSSALSNKTVVEEKKTTEEVTVLGEIGEETEAGLNDESQEEDDDDSGSFIHRYSQEKSSMRESLASHRPSLDDFDQLGILGEGQFGEVWAVSLRDSNHTTLSRDSEGDEELPVSSLHDCEFALKIQSKSVVLAASEDPESAAQRLKEAIQRECQVLSELVHPGIVEFVHDFEDDKAFYLVMGVIKGVELWNVIHQQDPETEEWYSGLYESDAKFYTLILADTFRYIHSRKICYRDLKPENVMVDFQTGYPILVDFGFAKYLPDGTTYTFCGTPNYTSPELIRNQGYGISADHWALGILVYEMLAGENPYYYDDISDLQLLQDIIDKDPRPMDNPEDYSKEALQFVNGLLIKEPKERLGAGENDNAILQHAWFSDLDINQARERRLVAPLRQGM